MEDPTLDRRSVLKTTGALAGASALGLFGTGAAGAEAAGIETATGNTDPQFELGAPEEFYVDVEIRNGEGETETPTLYGEIVRPIGADGEPIEDVPVVLTYTPYGDLYQPLNDGDSPALDGVAEYFVPRGYARAMFDLIGCRNSGGYYDYGGIRERLSGKELVEALAGFGWTNGNVGMIGGSYDGTTQYAAAIEDPDGLEAIVPQVAIDRWYDYRYFGGVPRSTVGTPTLFDFGFAAVPPHAREDQEHNAEATATRVEPGDRVEFERRSYEYGSVYDEFWVEREYRGRVDDVDCAVMIEGGWEDRNVIRWGSTRFYEALDDIGYDEKRLLMGDWGHSTPQYPDSRDLEHALYDEYLLDGDEAWLEVDDTGTDIMDLPAVDVESASTPRQQFETWPPGGAEELALPLVRSDADEGELGLVGTGVAAWEDRSPPVDEADFFAERGSGDRYLMFETPTLDDDLRVSGRVTADLLAASTGDTWYVAVLYERDADGGVRPFARGAVNSRFRNGEGTEEETPTDRAYRAGVEPWDANWSVSAGSRLGLVVASDNDDYVRHDPTNESTNQLVLGDSMLRFDGVADGVDATGFPDVSLSHETSASAYTGGQTARVEVTAETASDPALVRDRLPDGWTLVGGDAETVEAEGATYVEFDEPLAEGETATYFAEAPDAAEESDEYVLGPAEYSATGELWAGSGATTTVYVVGVET
jgi:X-Pro dipeptidyl-peptidase